MPTFWIKFALDPSMKCRRTRVAGLTVFVNCEACRKHYMDEYNNGPHPGNMKVIRQEDWVDG